MLKKETKTPQESIFGAKKAKFSIQQGDGDVFLNILMGNKTKSQQNAAHRDCFRKISEKNLNFHRYSSVEAPGKSWFFENREKNHKKGGSPRGD